MNQKISTGFLMAILFCLFSFTKGTAQIAASEARLVQPAKTETVAEIMERAKQFPEVKLVERPEREYPNRSNLPQNPLAKPWATFPPLDPGIISTPQPDAPQTPSTSFNGVTGPTETGSFPPDNMGAVGPTQYIVFVNGRIRTFNKTTGVADAVLNASPDAFFASVMTTVGGAVTQVFTSDPRIRYDRLSGKWILVIIDVPLNSTGGTPVANRILIAYSNSSTITGGTVWTFSQFTGEANKFTDYETLGIDVNALYIGTNMFTLAGSFTGTNGYVINRATLLSGAAYTVYSFLGLVASAAGAGPFTPQGVDNFDYAATEGYFIGVDNATFGTLMMRRVSTPAAVPTISANISIAVSTTASPRTVPHLGNTGGTNGNLDGLDDRLYAAMARGGHLWTAHNIGVNTSGVATSTTTIRRNGTRWYDLTNLTGTPTVTQSGTVFDGALQASARDFFIPSIMVTGQNHVALSLTTAGTPYRIDAYTVGRLSGDGLGTMQTPVATTASSTAYNPSGDPGGAGGRRWGDYSYVSLDPLDNMTMWMINQYCSGANLYGCNVTKLLAPPPATPASTSPASTPAGQLSVNVVVTGTSVSGSGFYDPGANLASPALPYSHITATVSGGVTVNSITYTDPTHITLNLNTVGSPQGAKNITITNPDGQVLTGNSIFSILGVVPITLKELKGRLNNNLTVSLYWTTSVESNNKGFFVERTETNDQTGWASIGFVAGAGNSSTEKNYSLIDNNIQLDKIYRYRLRQVDLDANFSYSNEVVVRVKDIQKSKLLLTNYPNPFKSVSTVKYNLPNSGMVSLKVFDITGKEVATLVNGFQQTGLYSKDFNAASLSNGIYFCKLSFEGETITNRIMLIQ